MSAAVVATTQHSIRYGDEVISFAVRRQPGRLPRTVSIHIEPDGGVKVDAPEEASDEHIRAAVKKRAPWISKHLHSIRTRMAHVLPREYVSGEACHYRGRRYQLKIIADEKAETRVRIRGGMLEIYVPSPTRPVVQQALQTWLRERAKKVLTERLAVVADSLAWVRKLPPVRLAEIKRQWGSCSPAGLLTLNIHLVKASRECIDYVLIHELCHLKEHNHGPRFYRLLDRHLPSWRETKIRLDDLAETLLRS